MADTTLDERYGANAARLFADFNEPAEIGGHAGVTRYLYDLWSMRQDLQRAYSPLDGDGAFRLVDWAYRFGIDEVPIVPELLPTDWLNQPAETGGEHGVTRYLALLHERTPGLQAGFPDLAGEDGPRYVAWARAQGIKLDPVLRVLLAPRPAARRRPAPAATPGVNVIGFLRGELGLGEAARLVIAALDGAQVPLVPVGVPLELSRAQHDFSVAELSEATFETDVICLNPDHHARVAHVRDSGLRDHYRIGFWWWEIAGALPLSWRLGFQLVDEVWVGSEHTASTLRELSPIPVLKMKIPVSPAPLPRLGRAALGLPPGFLFLTMFDYNSTVERKNPLAAIDAFKRAFAPGSGVTLVVKSVNGNRHATKRAALIEAAATHPDIHLVDRYADVAEKNAMLGACDAFVSMHRAEGFGLPLAEAMFLEKPAIATAYSGNLEFMTRENSYLIDYQMTKVGRDAEPYYPAEGEWADPDLEQAADAMRRVVEDPVAARERGRRAARDLRANFSPAAAGRLMAARLESLRADVKPTERDHELDARLSLMRRAASDSAGVRRLALRAMRPFTFNQQRFDERVVTALAQTRQRITDVDHGQALIRAELSLQLRRRDARLAKLEGELHALARTDAVENW